MSFELDLVHFVKNWDMIPKRIIKNQKRKKNKILSNIRPWNRTLLNKKDVFGYNGYALGRKDSNLRIAGPKPVALPLGYAPFILLLDTNTNKE